MKCLFTIAKLFFPTSNLWSKHGAFVSQRSESSEQHECDQRGATSTLDLPRHSIGGLNWDFDDVNRTGQPNREKFPSVLFLCTEDSFDLLLRCGAFHFAGLVDSSMVCSPVNGKP